LEDLFAEDATEQAKAEADQEQKVS
jgi:hypothetical protein